MVKQSGVLRKNPAAAPGNLPQSATVNEAGARAVAAPIERMRSLVAAYDALLAAQQPTEAAVYAATVARLWNAQVEVDVRARIVADAKALREAARAERRLHGVGRIRRAKSVRRTAPPTDTDGVACRD